MKTLFVLLALLLAGTAGAYRPQSPFSIDPTASDVMSWQQSKGTTVDTCYDPAKRGFASKWQPPEKDTSYDDFRVYSLSPEDRIATLESRLDSLEVKINRAHVVVRQDSEYVKVETFITGSFSEDTAPLRPPKWQWVKRVRYTISFEPEVKK